MLNRDMQAVSLLLNSTDGGDGGRYYRKNVNLYVDPWLHNFIVISSFVNLGLAIFTFIF